MSEAGISIAHITELKAFSAPPELVKVVLECVCLMLGYKEYDSWRGVQAAMGNKAVFIQAIKDFQPQSMSAKVMDKVRKDYLSRPDFSPSKVCSVSAACAPLCGWVLGNMHIAPALALLPRQPHSSSASAATRPHRCPLPRMLSAPTKRRTSHVCPSRLSRAARALAHAFASSKSRCRKRAPIARLGWPTGCTRAR